MLPIVTKWSTRGGIFLIVFILYMTALLNTRMSMQGHWIEVMPDGNELKQMRRGYLFNHDEAPDWDMYDIESFTVPSPGKARRTSSGDDETYWYKVSFKGSIMTLDNTGLNQQRYFVRVNENQAEQLAGGLKELEHFNQFELVRAMKGTFLWEFLYNPNVDPFRKE